MVVRVYAMLLGIAVAAFLPLADTIMALLAARESWFGYGVCAVIIAASTRFRGLLLSGLLAFCAGLLYASTHASAMFERLPWVSHEGELFEVNGMVVGLPRTEFRYGKPVQRFDLQVYGSSWSVSNKPIRKLRLSWYEGKSVGAGELWRMRVAVKRPRGFANPGSFDYQHYLHTQNIDATGTVRWGEPEITEATSWRSQIYAFRHRVASRLSVLTQGMQHHRFVRALALGDGKALSSDDWALLRRTGTTHLFVVSGLHIGMVAGISYLVLLPMARMVVVWLRAWSAQSLAALASLLCAFAYSWLAGFGLATQRAVIMLGVGLIAHHYLTPLRFSHLLAFAALLIVLLEPLSIRSPGFTLSFLAVATLLYSFAHRLSVSRSVLVPFLKAQWVSFIALSAILLFQFQESSLLMPLANFLAIPALSIVLLPLVMFLLLSTLLFDQIPAIALRILDVLFSHLWRCLDWLYSEAGTVAMVQGSLPYSSLMFIGLGALLLLAPPALRVRTAFAIPLLALPLVHALPSQHSLARPAEKQGICGAAKLTVLDVGQGLAVVFSAYGKHLLYDAGARFSAEFNSGAAIVAPYLRHAGASVVDTLVISHSDNDHAGGVPGLLETMTARKMLASYRFDGAEVESCQAGLHWRWQSVRFSMVSPANSRLNSAKADNDQSCVLKIDTPAASVLLTGDISRDIERDLVSSGASLKADILVMPHHGSKSSSSRDFIDAVAPDYAIASAGYKNRFNHPHSSVLLRYQQANVEVLNTASSGAIEFDIPLCKNQPLSAPREYRAQSNRFWLRW